MAKFTALPSGTVAAVKARARLRQQLSDAVDVRDGKAQRIIVKYLPGEQKFFALSEAASARAIRPKNELAPVPIGSVVCSECRHLNCQICEENSAARQYSDFWICHRCGELNRRV